MESFGSTVLVLFILTLAAPHKNEAITQSKKCAKGIESLSPARNNKYEK